MTREFETIMNHGRFGPGCWSTFLQHLSHGAKYYANKSSRMTESEAERDWVDEREAREMASS